MSLKLTQQGTFTARGAVSDRGLARGVDPSRQPRPHDDHARQQDGTHQAARHPGLWEVEEHVERHLRVRPVQGPVGRRQGKRPAHCAKKAPHRGVYTGTVRTPPPTAVAQAVATAARGSAPTSGSASTFCPTDARSQQSGAGSAARCQPARSSSSRTSSAAGIPCPTRAASRSRQTGTPSPEGLGANAKGSLASRPAAARSSRSTGPGVPRGRRRRSRGPLPGVHADRFRRLPGRDAGRLGDAGSVRGDSPLLRAGSRRSGFEYIYAGALALQPDLTFAGAFRTSRSRAADRSDSRCRASSTMPNGGSRDGRALERDGRP